MSQAAVAAKLPLGPVQLDGCVLVPEVLQGARPREHGPARASAGSATRYSGPAPFCFGASLRKASRTAWRKPSRNLGSAR